MTQTHIPFTFGFITDAAKNTNPYLLKAINSVKALSIPQVQIIVVGQKNNLVKALPKEVCVVDFNEKKKGWITKKKNLITQHAKFDNVVYLHDYVSLCPDWYEGFLSFGDDFKVCMTKIVNADGTRHRDWLLFPFRRNHPHRLKALWDYAGIQNRESLLPYTETRFSKWQYISGAYWVAKKHVMEEFPLNEKLVWGRAEDCEWSRRVVCKYDMSINPNSTARLLKQKPMQFKNMRPECYKRLEEYWQDVQAGKKPWWDA